MKYGISEGRRLLGGKALANCGLGKQLQIWATGIDLDDLHSFVGRNRLTPLHLPIEHTGVRFRGVLARTCALGESRLQDRELGAAMNNADAHAQARCQGREPAALIALGKGSVNKSAIATQ